MSIPIKHLSIEEIHAVIESAGLPKYRALQILSWMYSKNASSYQDMTDIPKTIREQLAQEYPLYSPKIPSRIESVDGTTKFLLEYEDQAYAECVGLPSADGRYTACISSQAGCAMHCKFCATGNAGLTRDLFAGEIADQVLIVERESGHRVTNIVVMGQGEPFRNYPQTLNALRILNHPKLVGVGSRHIVVSTCGVIEGIERFSKEPEQFTLAISLHSAIQDIRDELMPALRNDSLARLKETLIEYAERTGRRFSIEYTLLKGVNDSTECLEALIEYCKGMLCHVNLIPFNESCELTFEATPLSKIREWSSTLNNAGITSTIRVSKGADIAAACGQLANRKL